MWNGRTLAVVLPTYTEAASINESNRGFEALGMVDDIVVVDNNAHPDTAAEVAGTSARVVEEVVQGYGSAIQRGINRLYGSYWAVLPVDFAGDNRCVSGVFPFSPIRFPDRQRIVGATPAEYGAVIYMNSDADAASLLMPADRYERVVIGDRFVYVGMAGASAAASTG